MNVKLQKQLLDMAAEDRRVSRELAETGELYRGYAPGMADVHRRNADAMRAIIDEHGWPGKSLVGKEGAEAAWLIVQHAIADPELLRRSLVLLREAAARGDVEPWQPAYVEDRIAFSERRPQKYGTQFDWDHEGRMSPWTLAEPDRVEEYRREVGLEPLAERIKTMREGAGNEPVPDDLEEREAEMLEWARQVGWI